MQRNTALKIVNPILGLLLLNQIGTGLFGHSLPEGWFGIMHCRGGIAFTVVAALHVILNWNWLKANFLTCHCTPAKSG